MSTAPLTDAAPEGAPPSSTATAAMPPAASACVCGGADAAEVYKRIGALTRTLHDSLQQLGYDKAIEASLGMLPDARARLSFIARLTGDAAEKVLNTVDAAQAQQHALQERADRIEALLAADAPAALAGGQLHEFIGHVRANARATAAQLSEIMLAQDFHDLTGQTVRKVVEVAATLEESLVTLLLEATPPGHRPVAETAFLNGPVADAGERPDVVSSQAQVDDLLASLGF